MPVQQQPLPRFVISSTSRTCVFSSLINFLISGMAAIALARETEVRFLTTTIRPHSPPVFSRHLLSLLV